ncbi:MAG TPA: MFS transporter [Anaerolineae bacterium]|nr:MFS transporter [Anaerolineae bacterium]
MSYLHSLLTLPPDSDPDIARHFRRNFFANGMDMVSWLIGMSFMSVSAIMPVYVRHLTESPLIFGLIPALTDFGWFAPQLFFAPYVERLPRKYPWVMVLGAIERVPYLVMPLAVIALGGLPQNVAVLIFVILWMWKAFGSGFVATPWQEMLAKVIPVSHRGRFYGLANLTGQLLGVGGSALAVAILAAVSYPYNFALSFAIGALWLWISYGFITLTREPDRLAATHSQRLNREYGRRLLSILRRDVNFRTYLVSRWLAYFGSMATGFIAVYAVEQFHLPDSVAAVYTGILYAASVAGYGIGGTLGDRLGHRRVMLIAGAMWIAALGTMLLVTITQATWLLYVVFALLGFSNAGGVVSDFNLAMEFGPEAERPTYVGLARTSTGPALLIAPLIGGLIAQSIGYPAMFATSLFFAAGGLYLLSARVKEPRHLEKIESVVSVPEVL